MLASSPARQLARLPSGPHGPKQPAGGIRVSAANRDVDSRRGRLVDLVDTDHRISPEVSFVPTLGHTPGHVSVKISSRGEEALITGDFIHHPCQLAHPDWAATVDYDQKASTQTRRNVFSSLAGKPTLVIGTHFAGATAGRIVRDGDAFRLDL
jgi:glyoxylase-like metal-dependent hydrolase (beta-lactamase superfamily II)